MEGQQSLHHPPHLLSSGHFPPAATPATGDRCSQISPRSSIRCGTPCEPICAPPTTQDNTNHLRTLKHFCEPFVAEREGSDPEAPPDRTRRNGDEKEKQDKGLPSQVTPARSLLPAVRAVFACKKDAFLE